MITVDLSANSVNFEGRIYDPNGSGIHILGIRSRDPFSGSTDMSAEKQWLSLRNTKTDKNSEMKRYENFNKYAERMHVSNTPYFYIKLISVKLNEEALLFSTP